MIIINMQPKLKNIWILSDFVVGLQYQHYKMQQRE